MEDELSVEAKQENTLVLNLLDAVKVREGEFEKGWWKTAKIADDLYSADTKNSHSEEAVYNILYSNTEVLLPSLYSATPKPDIRSRFKGIDLKPIPEIIERFLIVASDPGHPGTDSLDAALSDAVLSALVPALGYVRIRYVESAAFPLIFESGRYNTIIWGKASRWAKVPWVAFKHPMKREQLFKQFEISSDDQVTKYIPSSESEEERDDCCVYEVWDKETRKVYFLSEEWEGKLVKVSDDPLGLVGFYPTPGLLLLTSKPGRLQPVPLYKYYQNQAEELNRVSTRLNKVLSAIKVRGAYNPLLGPDLSKMLSDESMENEFVPAGEAALLAQSGGFDKHIWMLPIERLIVVAQELYKAREAIKQVIYELTGISDIIRGSSVASETATAQDLKAKWGTVRLRKMQKIVADYARDLFRMAVDCGADHIPPEIWKSITQTQLPTQQEKLVAQQQLQYMQASAQQMQQMGQPPPPPDPKLLAAAQSPTMEEILAKIKIDATRTFVINVQTASTIDLDSSQDKGEVSEYMNAMGQLMSAAQPLMSLGPTGIEALKAMLAAVSQRYKFGLDISDVIKAIKYEPPPPEKPAGPPPPSPEELAVVKQEAEFKLAKIAAERVVLQAKTDYELAKIQADRQKLSLDIEAAQLNLKAKQAKVAASPSKDSNANVPS